VDLPHVSAETTTLLKIAGLNHRRAMRQLEKAAGPKL
jgi:hypothetical protein